MIKKNNAKNVYQDATYLAWLKNVDERDILETVLEDKIKVLCPNESVSILEMGCGLGSAAQKVVNVLERHNKKYNYTGVDPYKEQLDRFKIKSTSTDIELIQGAFEDFTSDKIYDVGLIVHSLYYVDDMKKAIQKMYNLAKQLVIVHHGKRGINTVHEQFPQYVKKEKNIVTTYDCVAQVLKDLNIPFELEERTAQINISSCKSPFSSQGNDLIRFFLETPSPTRIAISRVSEFLRTLPDTIPHDIGIFFTK